jgi:hypothetical protein
MKVFVAWPFSGVGTAGSFPDGEAALLRAVTGFFRERGHGVFNAHEAVSFDARMQSPREMVEQDFAELSGCDALVTRLGRSGGTHVELGWACLMRPRKRIVLLAGEGEALSPLAEGIPALGCDVEIVRFRDVESLLSGLSGLFPGP